jgi:hypothetical protein
VSDEGREGKRALRMVPRWTVPGMRRSACVAASSLLVVAIVGLLTAAPAAGAHVLATAGGGDDLASLTGLVHAPFLEWTLEASDLGGTNPFDVAASATFTRRGGGGTYRVPMFYTGDDVFAFRFTGPRTGVYDIVTQSTDSAALDGRTGVATIAANPDPEAKGFMTTVANADGTGSWAYLAGDDGQPRRMLFNPQVRAAGTTDPGGFSHLAVGLSSDADERGVQIEENLDSMEAHGFHAIEFNVAHNWVEWGLRNDQTSTNTEPDPFTFDVIEDLLERAYARGWFMHIWGWSDRQAGGSPADLEGGIDGFVDRRVQRMIVGRLGAYPNWSFSYGYDLEEYLTPAQARDWHARMRALGTLPRLYMAREADARAPDTVFDLGMEKLDVFSWDGRPEGDWFADALEQHRRSPEGMALIYERRFWSDRDGVWTEDVARSAAWQFAMANGVSAIFGQGRDGRGATPEYREPEVWRTLHEFWEERFAFPLAIQHDPADGFVLADGDERQVVYQVDTDSIDVVIAPGRDGVPVVAVDARSPYHEVDMGTLGAGRHTVTLPSRSDWALAVGSFELPDASP